MECLDENAIVALFEGRLPADAQALAEEHLADCATCRQVLAEVALMAPPRASTEVMGGTAGSAVERAAASVADDVSELGLRVAHAQALKRVGTVLCSKWRSGRAPRNPRNGAGLRGDPSQRARGRY